jgi:uncharacterized protein (DUF1778 family)
MARTSGVVKRERLEARITPEQQARIQSAAAHRGQSLTDFVGEGVQTAKEEVIGLSPRDRIRFVEALLDPPGPNAKLRALAKRCREFSGEQAMAEEQSLVASAPRVGSCLLWRGTTCYPVRPPLFPFAYFSPRL